MTRRPRADEAALEAMLQERRAVRPCDACPAGTRSTVRRCADGSLEVRCAGCGAALHAPLSASSPPAVSGA